MPRPVWWVILGAGFCVTVLPGCAQLDSYFSRGGANNGQPAVPTDAAIQQKKPGTVTVDEVEPRVKAPTRPGDASPSYQGVSRTGPLEGSNEPLPRGSASAEKMSPPQVPAALHMPQPQPQELAPLIARPPNIDAHAQIVEALERAAHCLLNKQTEEAVDILQACFDSTRQEYVMQLLIAAIGLNENKANQLTATEKELLEQQLKSLLAALGNRGELAIDTMCLVDGCDGYNSYKKVKAGHAFQPLEHVWIYVGLRNLAGAADGRVFKSVLHCKVSIQDASGAESFATNEGDKTLQSTSAHFDGYQTYPFTVPAVVQPGKYTLIVEIIDKSEQPHRVARNSVEFEVAAPGGQ